MPELIIAGAGPAGLTAAIYAVRRRVDVLLVSPDLGGKTRFRPSLPGLEEHRVIRGADLVSRFIKELEYLQFAHRLESVERIGQASSRESQESRFQVRLADGEELAARAVILATGCEAARLNVAGEKELFLKGVYSSAISYAHLFTDKAVLVVGDSPRALRAAAELALGASAVYLAGSFAKGSADPQAGKLKERLSSDSRLTLLEGWRLREIRGAGFVQEALLEGPEGESRTLRIDGLFNELEPRPNSEPVSGLVELNERGFVRVDSRNRTSRPGLFAAGDVTDVHREQILVAIGEGAKAALSAMEFLTL